MANEFTKVTINQIDMDAVTETVIAKGNLVYRGDHSDNKAEDVDKVGGVAADNIAVSIEGDRETIKNAQQLGGRPANQYTTKTESDSLQNRSEALRTKYSDDILGLRDELYQLRGQLAKNGYVKNIGYYDGFYDVFHEFNPMHLNKELANTLNVVQDDRKTLKLAPSSNMDNFSQFDFIAIVNSVTGLSCVRQIASIEPATYKITLDRNIANSVVTQNAEYYQVFKSFGTVRNGHWMYAKPAENVMGDEKFASGETDDTNRTYVKVTNSQTGFATTLKFAEGKTGYLKTVELALKAFGNPGPIQCYLIDAEDYDKFRNGPQAEALYKSSVANNDGKFKFFAKTQPKSVSATVERQYVKFSFQDNGAYPIIPDNYYEDPTRYLLIVEFTSVDTENYYEITLINHDNNNLQLNNVFYKYTRQSDTSVTRALDAADDKNDLYFQFITQEKITNAPNPVNEGLYSAHVYNRRLQHANRARVELRVKREGIYDASLLASPALITNEQISLKRNAKNATINSVHELGLKTEITKPIELRRGDISDVSMPVDIVIGENITKVKGFNTEGITVQTPVLINDGDPVYRVGYVVAIKAREYKFEGGQIKKGQFKRFILPLTEVVRDVKEYASGISDRLIFEAPLHGDKESVVDYNDFEVQVYWENPELSDSTITKQEQMGELNEITVSFASDVD